MLSSRAATGKVPGSPTAHDSNSDSDFADMFEDLGEVPGLSDVETDRESDPADSDAAQNNLDDNTALFQGAHDKTLIKDYTHFKVVFAGTSWESLSNATREYTGDGAESVSVLTAKHKDGTPAILRAFHVVAPKGSTYYVVTNPPDAEKMTRVLHPKGFLTRTLAEKIAAGTFEGVDVKNPRMCSATAIKILSKPAKASSKSRAKKADAGAPPSVQSDEHASALPVKQKHNPVDTNAPPSPKRAASSASLGTSSRLKRKAVIEVPPPSPLRRHGSGSKPIKPSSKRTKAMHPIKEVLEPPQPPTRAAGLSAPSQKGNPEVLASPALTLTVSAASVAELKQLVTQFL